MDGAEGCEVVAQGIHVGLARHIGNEDVGSGLCGERLEPVGPAGHTDHVPAVCTQQPNRGRTNT